MQPEGTCPEQGEDGGLRYGRCAPTADDQRVHLNTCGGEVAEDGQRVIAANPARYIESSRPADYGIAVYNDGDADFMASDQYLDSCFAAASLKY